jgi:hypothetical protein
VSQGGVEVEIVVFDAVGDAVLVRDGRTPQLPRITFPTRWPPMDHQVPAAVRAATGLRTVLLEPLSFTTLVVELTGPARPVPAGCRWVARTTHPSLGEHYRDWLARTAGTGADPRPPWFRPGWYERACRYLDGVINDLGAVRTGPIEQVKQWSMSSVLRAGSSRGRLFLKSVVPAFAHEPKVIEWLSRRWPEVVPVVHATAPEQGWWVAADLGDRTAAGQPPHDRGGCLDQLAQLQTAAAGGCDELVTAGCPRAEPAELARLIPDLLARDDLWEAAPDWRNRDRALSTAERDRLRAAGPVLLDRCAELAKLPLPDTIVHGDYQPTNVIVRDRGYGIIDWSFTSVGCPLFDLGSWLDEAGDAAAGADVRRYLRHWGAWVPEPEALHWWRVAKPLVAVVELKKFADLSTLVGPAYDFNWLGMTYSWSRRLMNAVDDTTARIPGWRK